MNLFSFIEGWFTKEKVSLDKLFKRIEPLVAKAEPIVKEVAEVATEGAALESGAPGALLLGIAKYLDKTIPVADVVDNFLKVNATTPINSLLHNTAALALQYTHGDASTDISDIDTAVQLAYSAVKQAASVPSSK